MIVLNAISIFAAVRTRNGVLTLSSDLGQIWILSLGLEVFGKEGSMPWLLGLVQ